MVELDQNDDKVNSGDQLGVARRLEMQPSPIPWAKVITDKPLNAKGTSLKFVALTLKEGKLIAKLDRDEVNHLAEVWPFAIIVYVVGNTPSIGMIIRHF